MPGPRWSTFPYHMTPNNPFGLVFNHYDYLDTFDNDVIQLTLEEAAHKIDEEISANPAVEHQLLPHGFDYSHPVPPEFEDAYWVNVGWWGGSTMTYGETRDLFALLRLWAHQWRTVGTSFEIWKWPGTVGQSMVGSGDLMFVF